MSHKIILGFDFGLKRIGVAVGQTITKTARPLETIKAHEGEPNWQSLNKLIYKWQPDALVVGVPVNMDGTPQKTTLLAQEFAKLLRERYQLQVFEIDERLTTKDARDRLFQQGGFQSLQGGQVDRLAAQLILQNWFAENT